MAKRRSINLKGFGHTNPIPVASRIGSLVMSGAIHPRDENGKIPDTLDAQCALMFQYVRDVMTEAGGTTDDIIKVIVGMKDPSNRELLNKHWVKVFPDPDSRPARHTEKRDLPPGILISCEITAVIGTD